MKKKLTATELIRTYDLTLEHAANGDVTGRVRINNAYRCKRDNAISDIAAAKPEIVEILTAQEIEQRRAAEERRARVDAIPGLKEIQAAKDDMERWRTEFEASFDDCGGIGVRPRPEHDISAMLRAYPQAAAYLKAEAYAHAAHHVKSAAGKKALEAIISGLDYDQAIATMETEWNTYVHEHIWD